MFQQKTLKIVFATIFSFALLFPIAVQGMHALDGHEHPICNDFTTHLHKKQVDCSICDFHFSIFDFKPQQLPEFLAIVPLFQLDFKGPNSAISVSPPHYYLRGPPQA